MSGWHTPRWYRVCLLMLKHRHLSPVSAYRNSDHIRPGPPKPYSTGIPACCLRHVRKFCNERKWGAQGGGDSTHPIEQGGTFRRGAGGLPRAISQGTALPGPRGKGSKMEGSNAHLSQWKSRRVHKSGYIQDTCPVSGGFAPRYSLTHFHPNIYQIPPQTRWSVCTRSFPLCYPPAIRCESPTPPPGQIAPQTRKRTAGKRGGARKQTSGKKERPIEYIQVPKHWFADPLNHALKTVVRPPTKLSRRKELTIEIKLPLPIFIDLMKPMDNGDMVEFEWEDEKKEALKPTTDKKSNTEYKYTIAKPEKVDKCWRLQDREPLWRTHKARKLVLSRRGLGSTRLHLSTAAEDRGKKKSDNFD